MDGVVVVVVVVDYQAREMIQTSRFGTIIITALLYSLGFCHLKLFPYLLLLSVHNRETSSVSLLPHPPVPSLLADPHSLNRFAIIFIYVFIPIH